MVATTSKQILAFNHRRDGITNEWEAVVDIRTRAICQIVLLALYPILQTLGFPASLLNAGLHTLWRYII